MVDPSTLWSVGLTCSSLLVRPGFQPLRRVATFLFISHRFLSLFFVPDGSPCPVVPWPLSFLRVLLLLQNDDSLCIGCLHLLS